MYVVPVHRRTRRRRLAVQLFCRGTWSRQLGRSARRSIQPFSPLLPGGDPVPVATHSFYFAEVFIFVTTPVCMSSCLHVVQAASPDFQTTYGYDFAPGQDAPHVAAPGSAMPATVNTSQMAHRFDCLAVTLEMPFKDAANNPMPDRGWSPKRCSIFGAAMVTAMRWIVPHLREEWNITTPGAKL
eukprot:SAG31_NODE_12006_length_978_cov_1.377702_1_plen_184_part_00